MNFNHLLLTSVPQKENLLEYGFVQEDKLLVFTKSLNEEFFVHEQLTWKTVTGCALITAGTLVMCL